jgi:hypothetical protein
MVLRLRKNLPSPSSVPAVAENGACLQALSFSAAVIAGRSSRISGSKLPNSLESLNIGNVSHRAPGRRSVGQTGKFVGRQYHCMS